MCEKDGKDRAISFLIKEKIVNIKLHVISS